ncbi:F0F1 ATP synthase subunit gamma [Candidatus Shapirobacteria bacterium]|nr:F0F1 ATP synthase subunit gamma [Candidatus Shapirobacteria bacterium]
MKTSAQVRAEIEWLRGLSELVMAYEEVAAVRMKKIRNEVLQNREFTTGLNQIYQRLKFTYKKEAEKYKLKQNISKNGKTARVFLSANAGFYGPIIQKTFQLFAADLKKEKSDAVIVGRVGRYLFSQAGIKKTEPLYFDFPDGSFDRQGLKEIADQLLPYEAVVVYHGQYQNIAVQNPLASSISGDQLGPEAGEPARASWIFEPSFSSLLSFFESEIFVSLFAHSMYESHLSKFACRMITLDEAAENINKGIAVSLFEKERLRHKQSSKKQLEALVRVVRN